MYRLSRKVKFKTLIPYVAVFLFFISIFFTEINNTDELWNYNFARCVYNGLLPYRDFSIIQTPLSAYFAVPFLWLFGDSLFSFRIAGYVLLVTIFIVYYKICLRMCKEESISLLITILMCALIPKMYNYNNLNYLLALVFLYIEISRRTVKQYDKLYVAVILGVISGTMILIKQTTGSFMMLANFVIAFYDWKKGNNKLSLSVLRVLISIIPVCIFVFLLNVFGIFDPFLEYAVFGLRTFVHRITFFEFMFSSIGTFIFGISAILIIFYAVIMYKKKKELREFIFIYFVIIGATSVIAYPLCDHHFYPLYATILLLMLYIVKFKKISKLQKIIVNSLMVFIVLLSSVISVSILRSDCKFSDLNHFNFIPIDTNIENSIMQIENYIRENESNGINVYVADASASAIMIPLDRYNKNYDMLLVGNVGFKTAEQLVNEKKDSLILVAKNEEKLGMQDHYELIRYVKKHCKYEKEVCGLEAYKVM